MTYIKLRICKILGFEMNELKMQFLRTFVIVIIVRSMSAKVTMKRAYMDLHEIKPSRYHARKRRTLNQTGVSTVKFIRLTPAADRISRHYMNHFMAAIPQTSKNNCSFHRTKHHLGLPLAHSACALSSPRNSLAALPRGTLGTP